MGTKTKLDPASLTKGGVGFQKGKTKEQQQREQTS